MDLGHVTVPMGAGRRRQALLCLSARADCRQAWQQIARLLHDWQSEAPFADPRVLAEATAALRCCQELITGVGEQLTREATSWSGPE